MPTVWFALKRSLRCKWEATDVHDPNTGGKTPSKVSTNRKQKARSGGSRFVANNKDVIHGSKRHMEKKLYLQSPRSVGSNELLNPITHEVVLNNATCELKITSSAFVGTVKPGTPVSVSGSHSLPPRKLRVSDSQSRKSRLGSTPWAITGGDSNSSRRLACNKCSEKFTKGEDLESHHLSNHAVTLLVEGDSSRNIVEMICKTSGDNSNGIERILKVHNLQRTIVEFEEYRETVKTNASKRAKKHTRCLADGNELLRFHGTTIECCLGSSNDVSGLCTSDKCNVCRILRHGFTINGGVGVFTASTSGRALEAVKSRDEEKKALIVCRVIAGRVHKPLENVEEIAGQSGFDSLGGKVGSNSSIEELFLLSPKALLPCFVVICKA